MIAAQWMDKVWLEVALIGGVSISLLGLILACYCLHRSRRHLQATQALYQRMNKELQVAKSGSIGMGQRLLAIEHKLNLTVSELDKTVSKQEQLESQDVDQLSYQNAIRLLNAGLGADEIARSCGLSRAEASLMVLMRSGGFSRDVA